MRNVSETLVDKIKTYLISITFFRKSCFYEIMWKENVEQDGPQMTKWRMRIACRIHTATNTTRST